jgi:hypothetical protein
VGIGKSSSVALEIHEDFLGLWLQAEQSGVRLPCAAGIWDLLFGAADLCDLESIELESIEESGSLDDLLNPWDPAEIPAARSAIDPIAELQMLLALHDELVLLFRRASNAGCAIPNAENLLDWLGREALTIIDEVGDDAIGDGNAQISAMQCEGFHDTAAMQFHFVLLPPGKRTVEGVIEHYTREVRRNAAWIRPGVSIDVGRLEAIRSLGPVDCFVGKKMWQGYVVFTFPGTDRVVLECPLEGNATYVLRGEWRRMVGLSKQELRRRYRDSYAKIVHKGDWPDRIRQRLGRSFATPRQYIAG